MRIVMIPKESMFPNSDMLHLLIEAQERGLKVYLSCEKEDSKKHMRKICVDKGISEPHYIMTETRKHKVALSTADIILCETAKDAGGIKGRKNQKIYNLDEVYNVFPSARPCFDDLGKGNKEELYKKLLADKIRRNNETLYYLRYDIQGNSKYEVSFFAIKLMELDASLTDNEIVLLECPREFDGMINKKAFQHIKFIYWRYIPSELMNVCDKLISNNDKTLREGYKALTRGAVIEFDDAKDIVKNLHKEIDTENINKNVYGLENTKMYMDYVLNH